MSPLLPGQTSEGSQPAAMTIPEPPPPAPLTFEQVREKVEQGAELVAQGVQPGTIPFHQSGALDWHGFTAWRAAHGGEDGAVTSEELDACQAGAVVDAAVETAYAKAEREAKERAEETPEAKAAREEWEAETGRTTHFAVPAPAAPPVEQAQ